MGYKRIRNGVFFLFFLQGIAFAGKFANQFTEFELPPQWQCSLEGAEWVCQSTNESKKKDAIIVLAAKIKGDQDSLDQYLTYLKAVKSFTSVDNKPVKSDPKYAKTQNINGHPWVDSLHLESEIPGFYTRYLATIKQDIGVLVTYSVNKAKYQDYLQDFDHMVNTLKVYRKVGGINVAPSQGSLFQNTQISNNVGTETIFHSEQIQGGADVAKPKPSTQQFPWGLVVLLVGAIGFFVWKRRKG
jgi:hypothetical protein